MTITQHAHIYSFHTSKFIFGQIIFLKFLSIPPLFKGDHASGMSGELKWISDKVATDGDTDVVGIFFLGMMINDNTSICYHLVGRNTMNVFIMGEEENGVGSCANSRLPWARGCSSSLLIAGTQRCLRSGSC